MLRSGVLQLKMAQGPTCLASKFLGGTRNAYAGSEKAAEVVGFCYAENASGRLIGTLLSGALYQVSGLSGFWLAVVMLVLGWLFTLILPTRLSEPVQVKQPPSRMPA
jgi:hypothetical protein